MKSMSFLIAIIIALLSIIGCQWNVPSPNRQPLLSSETPYITVNATTNKTSTVTMGAWTEPSPPDNHSQGIRDNLMKIPISDLVVINPDEMRAMSTNPSHPGNIYFYTGDGYLYSSEISDTPFITVVVDWQGNGVVTKGNYLFNDTTKEYYWENLK